MSSDLKNLAPIVFLDKDGVRITEIISIPLIDSIEIDNFLSWSDVACAIEKKILNGFVVKELSFNGRVTWRIDRIVDSVILLKEKTDACKLNVPIYATVYSIFDHARSILKPKPHSNFRELRAGAGIVEDLHEKPRVTDSGFTIHISHHCNSFIPSRDSPVIEVHDWYS